MYSITTPSTIFKIPQGLGIHILVTFCLPKLMKETTNLYSTYTISTIWNKHLGCHVYYYFSNTFVNKHMWIFEAIFYFVIPYYEHSFCHQKSCKTVLKHYYNLHVKCRKCAKKLNIVGSLHIHLHACSFACLYFYLTTKYADMTTRKKCMKCTVTSLLGW